MNRSLLPILLISFFLICDNLNAQFIEEYLSLSLGKNWVLENQIEEITIIERWANLRGKLINRKKNTYVYTDSSGLISKGETRKVVKTDTSEIEYTYFSRRDSSFQELFYENGNLIKRKTQGAVYYYTYNKDNKLQYVWIDNVSYGVNGDELETYFYDNNRLIKVQIDLLNCYEEGDRTANFELYPLKERRVVKIIYDENYLPVEINLYKGEDPLNLHLYRAIKHKFDSKNRPERSLFYGVSDDKYDLRFEHKYLYK